MVTMITMAASLSNIRLEACTCRQTHRWALACQQSWGWAACSQSWFRWPGCCSPGWSSQSWCPCSGPASPHFQRPFCWRFGRTPTVFDAQADHKAASTRHSSTRSCASSSLDCWQHRCFPTKNQLKLSRILAMPNWLRSCYACLSNPNVMMWSFEGQLGM